MVVKNYYVSGQWNFTCDSCGQKLKSGVAKERWDGFRVCPECWEPRHAQDFVRARQDKISVDWVRPQSELAFIDLSYQYSISDTANLLENVDTVTNYYRYFGRQEYPNDTDLINGAAINLLTINSNSVDPVPPSSLEIVTLSENLSFIHDHVAAISDSITLSELLSEEEGEYPSDSMTLTESVIYVNSTNRIINAHLVNEVTLG